jgi:hypothetical protein
MALGCKADHSTSVIADALQGFIDWHISEEADSVKTKRNIERLKVNRLQQLYEMA